MVIAVIPTVSFAQFFKGEKWVRVGVNCHQSVKNYTSFYSDSPNEYTNYTYTYKDCDLLPSIGTFVSKNWYLGVHALLGKGMNKVETQPKGGSIKEETSKNTFRLGAGLVLRKYFPVSRRFSVLAGTNTRYFKSCDTGEGYPVNTSSRKFRVNYLLSDLHVGVMYRVRPGVGVDLVYSPLMVGFSQSFGIMQQRGKVFNGGLGKEVDCFSLGLNFALAKGKK
ncbi:hypothetical protein GCM10028791_15940 [Echinicola sediminis]